MDEAIHEAVFKHICLIALNGPPYESGSGRCTPAIHHKVKKAQGTDITFCGLNDVRNIAPLHPVCQKKPG